MKTMEEGVVDDGEAFEMEQQGDKDCDFGNYIQDEDDNNSPEFIPPYYEESQTLANNKKEPKRSSHSVDALIRHFKIFFPKNKRSKHTAQSLPEPQQTGLRGFRFSDSKIGKEFDHFTMGHSMDFFTFDTEYIDDNMKAETAPPLHYNKRTRIIGDESIFRNGTHSDDQINSSTFESETMVTNIPQSEEMFSMSPPMNREQKNEYLLPDGLNSSSNPMSDHYQNYSNIDDNAHPTDEYIGNNANEDSLIHEDSYNEVPNIPLENNIEFEENREETNLYDHDTYSRTDEDIYNYEEPATRSQEEDVVEDEENQDGINEENTFMSQQEDPNFSDSTYTIHTDPPESFRHSAFIDEQFENIPMQHKSMPSLVDSPPKLPPIDPNRPIFRDEELKIFRSVDVTNSEPSETLKKTSKSVFGKALRRISSYFSLKKDKTWSVDPDEDVRLNKF